MTDTVKIVGMTLCTSRPWDNGDRLIATFDCEARGFLLRGCFLIKTPKNGFVAQAPRGVNERNPDTRAIRIVDSSLRHAIMDAARRSYVAFGGEGGEWSPRRDGE